jgi:hypothetical protein
MRTIRQPGCFTKSVRLSLFYSVGVYPPGRFGPVTTEGEQTDSRDCTELRLGYAMGQIFWAHRDSGGTQFNDSELRQLDQSCPVLDSLRISVLMPIRTILCISERFPDCHEYRAFDATRLLSDRLVEVLSLPMF